MDLREDPAAIDVSSLKTLSQVIERAAGTKIVYVGEQHDQHAHHAVQVRIIKGLYEKDPKIAVGMEMFQRPFQQVVDAFINGGIEEREFLKKSEYFIRWVYDYSLYKPILDFCRAEKIPVIALNLRREITEKVSKRGVDALSDDEKKEIPPRIDLSDAVYRKRLEEVFAEHKSRGERNFDFFYQAQVLWDETMAMSVDEYLRNNPDRRMIVIAGSGHLAYGSGIPKRVFRRNGFEYVTILSDAEVRPGIADYLVFPEPLDVIDAPKLMVTLSERDGRVVIDDLPEDSVSRNAGLKAGDVIVSLDGVPVGTIADVKIGLFYRKAGDAVAVRAMRRRFLAGDREMEFEVKLR